MRYSGTDCALMCNAPPMQLDAQVSSGSCYNYVDLLVVFTSNCTQSEVRQQLALILRAWLVSCLPSFSSNLTYELIIWFPVGQPLGHPRGTHGEWYSFGISFFPAGEGSCLVLETTLQNHRQKQTYGFVRVLVSGTSLWTKGFFPFHFISFRCQILILCCGCS